MAAKDPLQLNMLDFPSMLQVKLPDIDIHPQSNKFATGVDSPDHMCTLLC